MTLGARPRPDHQTQQKQDGLSGFMRRVAITDLVVIIWAVWGAQLLRFGPDAQDTKLASGAANFLDVPYAAFTVALIAAWLFMPRLHGAYDRRLLGHGPEEYKAISVGSLRLSTVIAIVSYVLHLSVARGYVAIALPAGTIGLLASRRAWRQWLAMHRAQGEMSGSVLVVGDREHLVDLIRALGSVPAAGYRVVAACCSDADRSDIGTVPVVGSESEAAEIATPGGSTSTRGPAPRPRGLAPAGSGASGRPIPKSAHGGSGKISQRPPTDRRSATLRGAWFRGRMTGLWEINGRSDLSWEEAVRFDLYYVENWSVVSDLIILWRTGRAVFHASGA